MPEAEGVEDGGVDEDGNRPADGYGDEEAEGYGDEQPDYGERQPMAMRANTSRERKDSLTMAMKERSSHQSTMVMKISQWTTGMRKDKMDTEWNSGTQCL